MSSLEQELRNNNSINALRLTLALSVIVSHARPLGGYGQDIGENGANLGQVAVGGFFVISGWLITGSADRTSVSRFLWHRFLRIIPALWVSLIVVVLVIAPLAFLRSHGTFHGYWNQSPSPVTYFFKNAAVHINQPNIGTLLAHNPFPLVWNGSLHTLWQECWCYIFVAALSRVRLNRGRRPWLVIAVSLWGLVGLQYNGHLIHLGLATNILDGYQATGSILAFSLGALGRRYASVIPVDDRLGVLATVTAIVSYIWTPAFIYAGFLAFAYSLFWLAVRPPARSIGRRNDVSYGVYIFAWPLQQLLTLVGVSRYGLIPYTFIVATLSVTLGFMSWRLVEEPALRLKDANMTRFRG